MEDDTLPPEVQAQVDAAKRGAAQEDEDEGKPESVEVQPQHLEKPLSRRQQAEQERIAQIDAASKRAEAAEKIADELRKSREQDVERFARMEQALSMLSQQQQYRQPEPQRQADPGPSVDDQVKKLRKERDKALADGDVSSYNEANEEIAKLHARASVQAESTAREQALQRLQQQQPQQFQKPPWVQAVEQQYPDVAIHPRGYNVVTAFLQMNGGGTPEALDNAFKRARDELGLGKKRDEKNEQQRAVLSGGPTSSTPRTGNGKNGKTVNMPDGWREAARKAQMSKDDYIRAHVLNHPEAVGKE